MSMRDEHFMHYVRLTEVYATYKGCVDSMRHARHIERFSDYRRGQL